MKKLLFLIIICISSQISLAQDTIYDRKNYNILAKVIEITKSDIKYRRFDNPDGPIYNISKSEVSFIKYENGLIEDYRNISEPYKPTRKEKRPENKWIPKGDKIISTGFWAFSEPDFVIYGSGWDEKTKGPVLGTFINFEKLYAENKIGLSISPFIGFNRKAYGSGFGLSFYPKNYGRAQFKIGPQYVFSVQDYWERHYDSENQYYKTTQFQTTLSHLLFNLGININASENWVISNNFGFGMTVGNSNYRNYFDQPFHRSNSAIENPVFSFRIGLGYRFK